MKKLMRIVLVSALLNFTAYPAFAGVQTIPVLHDGNDMGVPFTNGPIMLKVLEQSNPYFHDKLQIIYDGELEKLMPRKIYAGLIINGRSIRPVELSNGRSGFQATISLEGIEDGKLEIYIVDEAGRYDSLNGFNYRFELTR